MTGPEGFGEPRRRRRGCLFWGLLAAGVVVLVVVGLVATVVLYTRAHQDLELPADGGPIPTSPPVTREGSAVQVSDLSIKQGDNQRHVRVLSPFDLAPGERLPLVILLHGHDGDAGVVVDQGDWRPHVIDDRLIVAAPEGISRSWNAGGCCRLATTLGIEDVEFLDAAIADLSRRDSVDPTRVFMVGVSNGGMMAYRYLCDHAGRITAMASIEGTDMSGCEPSRSIPTLHIAGTADRVVPYAGGRSAVGAVLAGNPFPPVERSMTKVAAAQGCGATPTTTGDGSGLTTRQWTGCRRGATVRLDTVQDLAHVWPRGAPYDATDTVLAFFGLR